MERASFATQINQDNLSKFDDCMESVGMANRYQKWMLILFFPYWIVASFFVFQELYTFKQPIYRCLDQSLTQKQCKALVCSPGFPFEKNVNIVQEQTFTYQFDLFCHRQTIRIVYKLMPKVLAIIGYYIYGRVGDIKGRTVASKIAWRFFIIGCFFFALTKTQILITFGYILASVSCLPTLAIQFPILFQESNRKFWGVGSMAIVAWQGLGQFILSMIAMPIINNSSSSILILSLCAIPSFVCGLSLSYFIQSPKYIYQTDKLKALSVMNKIASKNKKDRLIIDLRKSNWIQACYRIKPLSISFMMYYSFLRIRLLVGLALFFACRSAMSSSQIMLDQYLDVNVRGAVIGASTVSANVLLCFMINKLPRNPGKVFVLLTIAGLIVFCLYVSISGQYVLIPLIIFSIICRFLSSFIYGMLLIWGVQTFPTVCRTTGYSFVLIGTGLGTIANYMLKDYQVAELVLIFGFSLLAIPVCRYFPETFNQTPIDEQYSQGFESKDRFYKY